MGVSQIISLLSGLALFLFGMTLMGEGLKRVSGSRIEPVLFRLSGTPIRGILLGTGVTAVIQSSSATSVMVVGFVNAGMMKVRQAISVILGAILGTSITGWVICLSYIDGTSGIASLLSTSTLTGLVAVIGIFLRMFSKKLTHHHVGDIMMGFAILMFGMSTMSGSVSSLGQQPWFTGLLTMFANPVVGILAGVVFSAVLQSASVAVGIVQALSVTGLMTLDSSLPLLMGITIGASLPVLLSALGAGTDGKRTAVSYLVASFLGVVICGVVFYAANAIFDFAFMDMVVNPFSLALVNTCQRLAILLVLSPFIDLLEKLSAWFVRGKPKEEHAFQLEERFLAHPALAIEQSRSVISEMAQEAQSSIKEAVGLLGHYSEEGFLEVKALEDKGDHYEDALGSYLVKLTGQELTARQGREVSIFLHTLSDFERLTDHAMNVAESAQEMEKKQLHFSEDTAQELAVLTDAVQETLRVTVDAFVHGDLEKARRVEPLEEVVDNLCSELKLRHVERLQKGQSTIAHGFVFNDLLTDFERMSDHCSNIAVAMIELEAGSFDTHEYLIQLKEKRSADFEHYYSIYRKQFAL